MLQCYDYYIIGQSQTNNELFNTYIILMPICFCMFIICKQCVLCQRSRDRTDIDVIRENHQFLWEDDDDEGSWWVHSTPSTFVYFNCETCLTLPLLTHLIVAPTYYNLIHNNLYVPVVLSLSQPLFY